MPPLTRDDVPISSPCPIEVDRLDGDGPTQHCGHCNTHVHNLSEMTADEARAVLSQGPVCVRYQSTTDGRLVHRPRRKLLVGLAATLLSGPAAASVAQTADTPRLLQRAWAWWTAPAPTVDTRGAVMGADDCERLKDLGYMSDCSHLQAAPTAAEEPLEEMLVVMGYVDIE